LAASIAAICACNAEDAARSASALVCRVGRSQRRTGGAKIHGGRTPAHLSVERGSSGSTQGLKQNGLRIMTRRPDGKLRRKMAFICHQIFGLLQKFSALTQCPAHIVRRDARSSSSRFTIASIPGWIWRSSAPHCLTALPVRVRERPNPTWLKCRGCGPCDRACRARPAGIAGHLSLVA